MERPVHVKCVNLDFLHKFQSGIEASAWWKACLLLSIERKVRFPLSLDAKESKHKWESLGCAEGGRAEASPQSWTLELPLNTSCTG